MWLCANAGIKMRGMIFYFQTIHSLKCHAKKHKTKKKNKKKLIIIIIIIIITIIIIIIIRNRSMKNVKNLEWCRKQIFKYFEQKTDTTLI